jgi:cellulose synthase/poly-beta-1,6-N-acetylglucosamine synthase-like glycosyltransferase
MQEWDYFLGIASVKRMQGLYQGTLVAQGAFSLYRTKALRAAGGWPDAIGEDIVLTWRLIGGPLPEVPRLRRGRVRLLVEPPVPVGRPPWRLVL